MSKKRASYTAAGGIVVRDDRVLVLRRPNPPSVPPNGGEEGGEVRLPKGHVDPGETAQEAALREVSEESGYADLVIEADLGTQLVEFEHEGRHVARTERYFLMSLADDAGPPGDGEKQFEPVWLPWDEALSVLTFEAEREWVRRARTVSNDQLTMDNDRMRRQSERA